MTQSIAELRARIGAARAPGALVGEAGWIALRVGCIHEWFGAADEGRRWSPPVCILADLARRAHAGGTGRRIFWIGASLWPYPLLLDQHRDVLSCSVLVDPPDQVSRLWSADVALRAGSIVVADAAGFTLPHTRRLQLAAGAGGGGLALLARPPWERDTLSAAATRWGIARAASLTGYPRWTLTLLRNKERPVFEQPTWTVEWNHAQGLVRVPAVVADRARRPAAWAS